MISTMQLQSISNLFNDKERELRDLVNNLQYKEIKSASALQSTLKHIEENLVLEPVAIGEPKVTKNRSEEKDMARSYQNPFGGRGTVHYITVEFPCSGSVDLFKYRGNAALTMGNIHLPSGSKISIEVIVSKLDKNEALTRANEEISVTKELIRMNNSEIGNWSNNIKQKIKTAVESKAVELKALYE